MNRYRAGVRKSRTRRVTLAETRAEVIEVERRIKKLILWASRDAHYHSRSDVEAWVYDSVRLANLRKVQALLVLCRRIRRRSKGAKNG